MKIIKITFILLSLIPFLSGCGTQVMNYKPDVTMPLEEASHIIDRLIMEQHRNWRPDFVEINDRYILLGYGMVTQGRNSAVLSGNVLVGSESSTTRSAGTRIYFESIDKVILYSWKRKFKQWYVVSLSGKRRHHILRTRYLDEAEQMADALQVILDHHDSNNL